MLKYSVLSLISPFSFAQNCNCDTLPILKDIINCTPYHFNNGNQIKWNYDCKASYLIFQNKNSSKILFELESPLINLTGRLGYTHWEEFEKHFIITNKLASGSHPAEYILFDKNTGDEIKQLGYEIDENEKFIFFLNYIDEDNLNVIVFEKNTSNLKYIDLPNKIIEESMKNSNYIFINYLFSIKNVDNIEPILIIENHKKANKDIEYIEVKLNILENN